MFKEGNRVVIENNTATVDFIHSDGMISIKYDSGQYVLVFPEQIKKI